MGSSNGTTELLFFIGAVVIATTIVAVLAGGIQSISAGVSDRSNSISDTLKSDISLVNDPGEVPNDPVKLYVKNTGVSTLDTNYLSVVLDGEILGEYDVSYVDTPGFLDDSLWGPGEVVKVEVTTDLSAGLHSAQVTMSGDVSDRIDFEIE